MVEKRFKPKLLFFEFRYDKHLPEFMKMHHSEHIKCLSAFFDVTVVNEDCDYRVMCDTYSPDICCFESGINVPGCRRLTIENVHAHPDVPKVGLLNADAWCESRAGSLSELEHWGVETYFSISVTAAEHTPSISERVYSWPNFIDPELFHDYGESKIIPVLITGAQHPQYPWRRQIYKLLSQHYPSLCCPHHGYLSAASSGQALFGERYARTLNASLVVPACGTVAKEVVRKHFEIPGCNACMVTEYSPALAAAGFVDMVNCVFADEHNVLDKVAFVFENPGKLAEIAKAGFDLVHSRHTLQNRNQLAQWLNLHRNLKPGERIIQKGPFESLAIAAAQERNHYVVSAGQHLLELQRGDEELSSARYDEAERHYLKCLTYMQRLPEAKLRLGICNLLKGNATAASDWISEPIEYTLTNYKAVDPDPVEWAYYIIVALCQGNLSEATCRATAFQWLHHPELERSRNVVGILNPSCFVPESITAASELTIRTSVHQLPMRSSRQWYENLFSMLRACRRAAVAEQLSSAVCQDEDGSIRRPSTTSILAIGEVLSKSISQDSRRYVTQMRESRSSRQLKRRVFWTKVKNKIRLAGLRVAHRAEQKVGYFLPYEYSTERSDELHRLIRESSGDEDIVVALAITGPRHHGLCRAIFAGFERKRSKAILFRISERSTGSIAAPSAGLPGVKSYQLPQEYDIPSGERLTKAIETIKQDHQVATFDLILVESGHGKQHSDFGGCLLQELSQAKLVVLLNISRYPSGNSVYRSLLDQRGHILVHQNSDLHGGYAIFRKEIVLNPSINEAGAIPAYES